MIHSTAIIDPKAEIETGVEIGPYSVIGADVRIGSGTRVGSHVVIQGPTTIGRNNRVFHFCSLGEAPQDKKYNGEPTALEIGDGNTIREYCTINRGTAQDVGVTRIGNDNWIMAYVHVAHDCQIGSHTILANSVTLAGHVHVEDYAILGGATLVHQFCRLGAHIIVGGGSRLRQDVPPYIMADGSEVKPHGLNVEGLKRRGFSPETITHLKRAYKTIYKSGLTLEEAKQQLAEQRKACAEVGLFLDFLEASTRGIIR
jgi:UDP-N-acetylglucosamine acyltransferase